MNFLYNGGLQIRSENARDTFFDMNTFKKGNFALHILYEEIEPSDIPIAQDCFGDQFLIRNDQVIKLDAELGSIEKFNMNWQEFLKWIEEDPFHRLNISEKTNVSEGKLLLAYPPFCTSEGQKATINEIDGFEVIQFHAKLAQVIDQVQEEELLSFSLEQTLENN